MKTAYVLEEASIKVGALIYYSPVSLDEYVRTASGDAGSLELCFVQNRKWGELWIPPGGGYEEEKDGPLTRHGVYKRTLVREVKEELGLELDDIVYTKTKRVLPHAAYRGPQSQIRFVDFYARAQTKDVILNYATDGSEIQAARWITIHDTKTNPYIPNPVPDFISCFERYVMRKMRAYGALQK